MHSKSILLIMILKNVYDVLVSVLAHDVQCHEGKQSHGRINIARYGRRIKLLHFPEENVLYGLAKRPHKKKQEKENREVIASCKVRWVVFDGLGLLLLKFFLVFERVQRDEHDGK